MGFSRGVRVIEKFIVPPIQTLVSLISTQMMCVIRCMEMVNNGSNKVLPGLSQGRGRNQDQDRLLEERFRHSGKVLLAPVTPYPAFLSISSWVFVFSLMSVCVCVSVSPSKEIKVMIGVRRSSLSSSCGSSGYYSSSPTLSSSPPVLCNPKSGKITLYL